MKVVKINVIAPSAISRYCTKSKSLIRYCTGSKSLILRGYLVFKKLSLITPHSILITHHSLLITHHSLFKIPQLPKGGTFGTLFSTSYNSKICTFCRTIPEHHLNIISHVVSHFYTNERHVANNKSKA